MKIKNPIYKVLSEFKKITGISVLMNTSFNGPGQPIVETYEDAIEFFINSELDNLYIENFEIKKEHKMTILGIHCGFSIHTRTWGCIN